MTMTIKTKLHTLSSICEYNCAKVLTIIISSDHVYYRWPRSTYRPTIDRYIGRLSVGNWPTIGRQSTDSRQIYRPMVDQCITRYIHIHRSTVGRYIGRLSADASAGMCTFVGRLSADIPVHCRLIYRWTIDR